MSGILLEEGILLWNGCLEVYIENLQFTSEIEMCNSVGLIPIFRPQDRVSAQFQLYWGLPNAVSMNRISVHIPVSIRKLSSWHKSFIIRLYSSDFPASNTHLIHVVYLRPTTIQLN